MKFNCHVLFLVSLLTSLMCTGQSAAPDYSYYDSINFQAGYNFSFEGPNDRNIHLLEVGIHKLRYGGRHGGGFQYGFITEVGLNTKEFVIGPKVSGVIYYQFLVLGSELVTYTNFNDWTLRYVPIIGIGGNGFQLVLKPQVILTHKNYQPINKLELHLSALFPLWKKKSF